MRARGYYVIYDDGSRDLLLININTMSDDNIISSMRQDCAMSI